MVFILTDYSREVEGEKKGSRKNIQLEGKGACKKAKKKKKRFAEVT